MDAETTRPSLLSRCREPGDREAWQEFESRYGELVLVYCRQRGLQAADAEDVQQIVFFSLAKALPAFRYSPARGRFRSYLGRVTQNAIQRLLSRPPDRSILLWEPEEVLRLDDPRDSLDERWEEEWVNHHYRLALRTVRKSHSPRLLQVFEDLVQGATVENVAGRHGMTAAAVRKVRHRLQEELRLQVQRQLEDEDEPLPPIDEERRGTRRR